MKAIMALGVMALAISGLFVMFLYGKGPDYQVLYSGISPQDSASVIDRLKEKRVPYRVEGNTISVEGGRVYEMRMELAGEGIPQGGGVGFEIFDKTGFGVTEFVQKVNYRRALQGELSRTISQIKEVESARVHLAIPEKGVFVGADKEARASIILKLRSGKTLSDGQVSAIVHLVASSFENLKPQDVTVVDTAGRLWTKGSGDDGSNSLLSASQLDYRRAMEKDLEERVESMLEKTVGAGKAVARVSIEADSRQIEKTEETYDPDSQVIRSEQRGSERTVAGASTGGVPGVLSNVPDSTPPAPSTQPSETNRKDEVINYEISKTVSRIIEPVNEIKRLTVAVLVDGTYETVKGEGGEGGEGGAGAAETRKFIPRSEAEVAKFTEMVKAAVGFTEARGDKVTVVSAPMEAEFTEAPEEPLPEPPIPAFIMPLIPVFIKYLSFLIIAALAILFVIKPAVKNLLEDDSRSNLSRKGLPEGAARALMDSNHGAEAATQDESVEKLKKMVSDNPQQTAMILKGWVKER